MPDDKAPPARRHTDVRRKVEQAHREGHGLQLSREDVASLAALIEIVERR